MNTKTLLIAIFSIFAVSSCGGDKPAAVVDPLLKPFFEKFEKQMGIPVSHITGIISPLPVGIAANCGIYPDGPLTRFDPVVWANANDEYKEEVVFHELGHCAMNLGHNPNLLDSGCPESIMYPYAFGDQNCYVDNKEYYYFLQLKQETSVIGSIKVEGSSPQTDTAY